MSRIAVFSTVLSWLMVTAVHGAPDMPTKKAKERAEAFLANPKAFQLRLVYHGDQDKPFYIGLPTCSAFIFHKRRGAAEQIADAPAQKRLTGPSQSPKKSVNHSTPRCEDSFHACSP